MSEHEKVKAEDDRERFRVHCKFSHFAFDDPIVIVAPEQTPLLLRWWVGAALAAVTLLLWAANARAALEPCFDSLGRPAMHYDVEAAANCATGRYPIKQSIERTDPDLFIFFGRPTSPDELLRSPLYAPYFFEPNTDWPPAKPWWERTRPKMHMDTTDLTEWGWTLPPTPRPAAPKRRRTDPGS